MRSKSSINSVSISQCPEVRGLLFQSIHKDYARLVSFGGPSFMDPKPQTLLNSGLFLVRPASLRQSKQLDQGNNKVSSEPQTLNPKTLKTLRLKT